LFKNGRVAESDETPTIRRIDKDAKNQRKQRIFDLWLAGYSATEIADAVGWSQQSVADEIKTFTDFHDSGKIGKSARNLANHETDFEPPIYNVWKQQSKSEGSSHFGNSEVRWVESKGSFGRNRKF